MKDPCSKSSSSPKRLPAFAVGLLLGGLVGAAVMLLMAPRSGKKTRSRIQKQGGELRDEAVERMEDVVTEAGEAPVPAAAFALRGPTVAHSAPVNPVSGTRQLPWSIAASAVVALAFAAANDL